MIFRTTQKVFPADDYDLAKTLVSGQAFRWQYINGAWESVIDACWVRLRQMPDAIVAEIIAAPRRADSRPARPGDIPLPEEKSGINSYWESLKNYLQLDVNLPEIISTFPDDEPMRAAVKSCCGLRLLRQNPWECLASFILSSTKQIVQIQQIVQLLCRRFGEKVLVPIGHEPAFAFPHFTTIAALTEKDLRDCKMGFRAPYLLGTAKMLVNNEVNLERLHEFTVKEARIELLKFPGVGRKIADCVLLFAYGFSEAFPVDVWVIKALRQLYFPKRSVKLKRLQNFAQTHFGPNAGYAQQYLFHYMRTQKPLLVPTK